MKKLSIYNVHELAKSRDGSCRAKSYTNGHTPMKWRCAIGHTWKASYFNVKRGGWCPVCSRKAKPTIASIRALARSRGGKCLSPNYVNAFTPLVWSCHLNHTWTARANGVKSGTWCPECARNSRTRPKSTSDKCIAGTL